MNKASLPQIHVLFLIPGFLINIMLFVLFLNLLTDKAQSCQIIAHFIFLSLERLSETIFDPIKHDPHFFTGYNLSMMRFKHKEQDATRQRYVHRPRSEYVKKEKE